MLQLIVEFFQIAYLKATSLLVNSNIKHLLLAASIFILAFTIQKNAYKYGDSKDKAKMTRLLKYSGIFPDTINNIKNDARSILIRKDLSEELSYVTVLLPMVVNCKVERIHQQLTDVILKAHNHLTVAREFMVQSFVCTSTSAIFFIISGIALAFITKSGFSQANPYFITILICAIAVGSFFVGLTNIFKQEQNAKDNLALYIKYINLEQAIRSELVTNKYILQNANFPCDTTSVLNKTILAFDNEMREINQIALGFNVEAVRSLTNLGLQDDLKTKQQ